jgi:D-arabinose 5-phosphate isomerase GutQ
MSSQRDLLDAALERVQAEAAAVAATGAVFGPDTIAIVRLLVDLPGKAYVSGAGTSGAIARRMAHLFSVCGVPSQFLHPDDALHGCMGALRSGDALVVISRGGDSEDLVALADRASVRQVVVIGLTNTPDSPLARIVHHVQVFPTPAGADPGDLLAMGTNLMHAAWGDAVAVLLMRLRGYGWDQVLFTHPAGAVGGLRQLPPSLPPLTLPSEA